MNIARLFQAVAMFAWLGFFVVIALVVVQASRKTPVKRGGTLVLIVALVAIVFSTVSAGLVFIEPQERGVVISAIDPRGYREQALQPGLHWVIPFAESVVTYPISRQTYTMSIAPSEGQISGDDSIEARTSDGQKVLIDASIIFAVDPAEVVKVHITWQNRYDRDLVRAQARGVIRDAVSQFGIEEVYSSKRFELVDMVRTELKNKLDENGLILVDFVLRNISFSDEYAASVEQKQIAEQLAQQGKFVVEQKKQEAEQARQIAEGRADAAVIEAQGRADARLIEADAEAKALLLVAAAIRDNPDLLTYQYINQITPNIEVMLLPSNAPFVFPLPQMGPTAPSSIIPGE
jgi:regulator of protease activity HflC (stomatin/prohibitin superfamily)